jgi:hypothetical protein
LGAAIGAAKGAADFSEGKIFQWFENESAYIP